MSFFPQLSASVDCAAPASVAGSLSHRALRFRRGACRSASLADLYCAFAMTFLRGCYHQILGPRRHLPKFSNSLCRHAGACVRLNLHLGWQAAESYVERSNAFALIPGHRVLVDCSAAEQSPPLKALLSRDMRRSEGMGRSKGPRTTSRMYYRTLLGPANCAILSTASREKMRLELE